MTAEKPTYFIGIHRKRSKTPMTSSQPFCNTLARERGLDPAGYAGACDLFVAFELPLPWPYDLWRSAGMPEEVRRLIEVWYGDPDTPRPRLRPLAVAPDPETSSPDRRRVMVHRRPPAPFAAFTKEEYRLPEAKLGPLIWALLLEPETLNAFEAYREPHRSTHDLLICTHGAVDAACAKFGFPLYRALRNRAEAITEDQVRVWRVTHFGGHVFAPTLLELPSGRYWAYLDGEAPEQLLMRTGAVENLCGHYRGWAGLDSSFLQAAEREVWQLEGWAWLDYEKRGVTLERGEQVPYLDENAWEVVRLEFRRPDSTAGAYEAHVELAESIVTPSSTGDEEGHAYPQYRVTWLKLLT